MIKCGTGYHQIFNILNFSIERENDKFRVQKNGNFGLTKVKQSEKNGFKNYQVPTVKNTVINTRKIS